MQTGALYAIINRLSQKKDKILTRLYSDLSPWEKVLVARHPERPHTLDYIKHLFSDFFPLAGDRAFAEDAAIVGGLARLNGTTVMVLGHEKGNDTQTRLEHNFGSPRPEGYRKAIRLMKLAEHYNIPVITLVDTAGAYPGAEAEERGQGQAIADCISTLMTLKVPVICCVIGEGGSGGALALSVADKILMLEHSVYSVISPEGCASILWKDFKYACKSAEILKLTATDLLRFGIIDAVIPEPKGGAHRHPEAAMQSAQQAVETALEGLKNLSPIKLVNSRRDKFLKMTTNLSK